MSDVNTTPAKQDKLQEAYQDAAKDDSFAPSPRVRGAVLMYARTLADHRNAFPGSVAHRNEDEELELSSVPRAQGTLDPRPLPVKPLEEESPEVHDSWPRDLPPVAAPSVWASLGKWVAAAAAGGLALGASYSWFNASFHKPAAPEPMIAQAPAPAPVPAPPVVNIPVPAPVSPAPQAVAQTPNDKPSLAEARAQAPAAAAAKAAPAAKVKTAKEAGNTAKTPAAARERKELPIGAVSNPPVMVADGQAVAQPQIAARSLSSAPASEPVAVAAAAPAPAAPAPYAAAPAAAARAAPAVLASKAESKADSVDNANAGNAINKALARPEHEADPQKWLAYIQDLRSRGRSREASIELVRLRERYPQFNAGTAAQPATPAASSPAAQ